MNVLILANSSSFAFAGTVARALGFSSSTRSGTVILSRPLFLMSSD